MVSYPSRANRGRWATANGLVLYVETGETLSGCPACGVIAIGHGRHQVRLHDISLFRRAGAAAVGQAPLALPGPGLSGEHLHRGTPAGGTAGETHRQGRPVGDRRAAAFRHLGRPRPPPRFCNAWVTVGCDPETGVSLVIWTDSGDGVGSDSQRRQVPLWVRFLLPTVIFAVGVVLLVLVLALIFLDDEGRKSTLVEIGKLCAQFVILVLLGLLVTGSLNQLRAREGELRAVRERRESHVRRLIDLTHEIDLARLLISANRSVKSWSEQMIDRVIPAYTELRDLAHDQKTASAAGESIFASEAKILESVQDMNGWLQALCTEFANTKKDLSELQLKAENDRSMQDDVWARMQALLFLGDLVRDGEKHRNFRETYKVVLTLMRSELSTRGMSGSVRPEGGKEFAGSPVLEAEGSQA
jgi:hypothetical protein